MKLGLETGAVIVLDRFDGERGEGVADRALPPGSRPGGAIGGRRVRLKVERCARATPGPFRVRVRFVDLERDLREKILRGVTQPPDGSCR